MQAALLAYVLQLAMPVYLTRMVVCPSCVAHGIALVYPVARCKGSCYSCDLCLINTSADRGLLQHTENFRLAYLRVTYRRLLSCSSC